MPVNWYGDKVAARVRGAQRQFIRAVALQIEGQTKQNIVDNNQVDTGFLLNSVYTVAPGTITYDRAGRRTTKIVARLKKGKKGRTFRARRLAPVVAPTDIEMGAIVGVGAEYAFFQEERHSFLLAAVRTVANQLPNVQVVD